MPKYKIRETIEMETSDISRGLVPEERVRTMVEPRQDCRNSEAFYAISSSHNTHAGFGRGCRSRLSGLRHSSRYRFVWHRIGVLVWNCSFRNFYSRRHRIASSLPKGCMKLGSAIGRTRPTDCFFGFRDCGILDFSGGRCRQAGDMRRLQSQNCYRLPTSLSQISESLEYRPVTCFWD